MRHTPTTVRRSTFALGSLKFTSCSNAHYHTTTRQRKLDSILYEIIADLRYSVIVSVNLPFPTTVWEEFGVVIEIFLGELSLEIELNLMMKNSQCEDLRI